MGGGLGGIFFFLIPLLCLSVYKTGKRKLSTSSFKNPGCYELLMIVKGSAKSGGKLERPTSQEKVAIEVQLIGN